MNIDSIQMKLKTYSKKHKRIHQFTLTRYFQERFLYRLSESGYRNNFLLKGGALVYYLSNQTSRYTRDIDLLLTKLESENDKLLEVFSAICEIDYDDRVHFDRDEITIEQIQKEGQYTGTRIKIPARLGNVKHQLQIDIGVGDKVTPGPREINYPTLLDNLASPVLQAYSLETFIAEKFEAMIALGEYNSRMKDFYDVHCYIEKCQMEVLKVAINNTFSRRNTPIIEAHPIFEQDFYESERRVKQWEIFLNKNELEKIAFPEVGNRIKKYLYSIYELMEK